MEGVLAIIEIELDESLAGQSEPRFLIELAPGIGARVFERS